MTAARLALCPSELGDSAPEVDDDARDGVGPSACTPEPIVLSVGTASVELSSAALPDAIVTGQALSDCLGVALSDVGQVMATFRPAVSAVYRVRVAATDGNYHPHHLARVTACEALCAGVREPMPSAGMWLEAGVDHTFVVLATRAPAFDFRLEVGAPCFPACDGKGCGPDGCGGSSDGVVTTDCTTACDAPVALLEAYAQNRVDLIGGTTYWIVLNGFRRSDVLWLEETILRVDPPCFPSCAGATCGSDGCGGACGTCAGDSGDECDESARQCRPVAEVCADGTGGFACDVDGYVCDPAGCFQHNELRVGVNDWRIIASSSGDFYADIGGGTVLDFALTEPVTVTLRAPSGADFAVTFTWGPSVEVTAIVAL